MSNINNDEKSAVQVAVRVRPINHKEVGTDNIVTCKKSIIYLKNPEDKKRNLLHMTTYMILIRHRNPFIMI